MIAQRQTTPRAKHIATWMVRGHGVSFAEWMARHRRWDRLAVCGFPLGLVLVFLAVCVVATVAIVGRAARVW